MLLAFGYLERYHSVEQRRIIWYCMPELNWPYLLERQVNYPIFECSLKKLVGVGRFELPTSQFQTEPSDQTDITLR